MGKPALRRAGGLCRHPRHAVPGTPAPDARAAGVGRSAGWFVRFPGHDDRASDSGQLLFPASYVRLAPARVPGRRPSAMQRPEGVVHQERRPHERLGHANGAFAWALPLRGACGADDCQDRRQDVLAHGDRFGGAAVEPVGEPVVGGLPDGVGTQPALGVMPLSSWVCRSRSLSMMAALVWPLTLLRVRLPSPVYPRVISPRHRPGQFRWRCGSRKGRGVRMRCRLHRACSGPSWLQGPLVGTISGDSCRTRPGTPRLFRTMNSRSMASSPHVLPGRRMTGCPW